MRRLPIAALAVVIAGCAPAGAETAAPTTTVPTPSDELCHVTMPGDGMPAPPGFSAPSVPGNVWYGTPELFTQLPVDGDYGPRKSVWWSVDFPGGAAEERPAIAVTWQRLDVAADPVTSDRGTNAYTDEDGWFMIAGIDPDEPGCWRVTATYEGATVDYVYQR